MDQSPSPVTPHKLWRAAGWAILASLLVGLGFFCCLPFIRSDVADIDWPELPQVCFGAAMVFAGLALSRRAGVLQYLTFGATAAALVAYFWAAGMIMLSAAVTGVAAH